MEGLVSADKKTVLPLKKASIQVKVKGYLVGISATLSYANDTRNPMEVVFRFPLEESFAVVGLQAVIDGRKVKGKVQEKQTARNMHDDATASGLSAVYGDEKSGNVFSLSLGNLPSGSEAQISINTVGELPIEEDGRARFTLPSVLKPHCSPDVEEASDPQADVLNTSVKQTSFAEVFDFRMGVEGPVRVSEVSSSTHKLKTEQVTDCAVNVCIAEESLLRGDCTILIEYINPHEPMAMVEPAVEGSKTKEMKSKAVMLNLFPKLPSTEVACEFIFIVDRSGSMDGPYIKSASKMLVLLLKSIPEGCYFNIFSFGSWYESFFSSSQPFNQETMEKATRFAEKMQADFGGTELLAPLQSIFRQKPQSSGLPRQVFILMNSNGSVSNTSSIISEVRRNSHNIRCFTFGIGSRVSTALVKGIAHAGNGSAEFIADNEQMQYKVIRSLKKALQPSLNNIAVTFDLPNDYQVKVVPEKIPSIYNGEKATIYGLLMEISEQKKESIKLKATLTGDISGKNFKFDIPFELTKGQSEEPTSVIHQLAVKGIIQEWQDNEEQYEQKLKKEIIELSTDASVVSRYTAYIAVDVAQNKPVSGSMHRYELTTADRMVCGGHGHGLQSKCHTVHMSQSVQSKVLKILMMRMKPESADALMLEISSALQLKKPKAPQSITRSKGACTDISDEKDELLQASEVLYSLGLSLPIEGEFYVDINGDSDEFKRFATHPVKQVGASSIVNLQQANGSWLLNDQLAGVVAKSVEELKSCCPFSCDDTMMANIWATLVVIELLKKKYPFMLEELDLVIMKAEQWLSKQFLPSSTNLATMKESATKAV